MNGWVNGGGSLGELMRQLAFQAHTNDTAVTSGLQPALCAHVTARGPSQSRAGKHNATHLLQIGRLGSE